MAASVRYAVREWFGQGACLIHRDTVQPNAEEARALLLWLAPFTKGAVAYAVRIDERGEDTGPLEIMDSAGDVPSRVA